MKHDTSSAIDDAALWTSGCGNIGEDEPFRVGLILLNLLFTASYVVKNAPAIGVLAFTLSLANKKKKNHRYTYRKVW